MSPYTLSGDLGAGPMISYNMLLQMANVIKNASRDYRIIQWARGMVSNCAWKDAGCEINSIYIYLQKHVHYVHDPADIELIATPALAMQQINQGNIFFGDCDDMTVLSLSLLMAIGYHVRIRAVSYDPSRDLSHVYGIVEIEPDKWISFDLIKAGGSAGFEQPGATNVFDWEIT
jgi:hypothetical protein